jgi:WD40 repeat protein
MAASALYCNECGASNPVEATHCFACNASLLSFAPQPSLQKLRRQATVTSPFVPDDKTIGLLPSSYLLCSRYSIAGQVGTGGFGAVYQAKDTLFTNRFVAVKEMSQDGLGTHELAEALAAFEHEALILANLAHPNLPRIHDHFSEHGRSYVVMDFIPGYTLEDYLAKFAKHLSVEDALKIGLQLCSVLDYLHTRKPPIVFRDLKPANIMLTADNDAYLIDFGIARHFKPGKAKDTIPLGSKGYAAPEQYGKAQTTPQTDIYGLGATLHELLTGEDPSLALFHFEHVKLPNSPIEAQLNTLLQQMLEMEMSKRPASIAVVKQELRDLLARQTAKKLSVSQQKAQIKIRRRTFLIGLASSLAVCGASSALSVYLFNEQNSSVNSAVHALIGSTPSSSSKQVTGKFQADVITRNKALYVYTANQGTISSVAWVPRGQQIASAGTLDSVVRVWDAYTGTPDGFYDANGQIGVGENQSSSISEGTALSSSNNQTIDALAWSPDGTQFAAAITNDSVQIWDLVTGTTNFFGPGQPESTNTLTWSPDGSQIAFVTSNTLIRLYSAATGTFILPYAGHLQPVLALAWSPDGTRIASGGNDTTVQVWDASSGYLYVTYRGHSGAINAISWSPDGRYIASGGADGRVQVWDAMTGRTLFTYRGHSGEVNAVAWQKEPGPFTAFGSRIASGGADATVQVWSIGKAKQASNAQAMTVEGKILLYRGHSAQVLSVSWAPDGQHIASGSEDGTVQVWLAM